MSRETECERVIQINKKRIPYHQTDNSDNYRQIQKSLKKDNDKYQL